MKFCNIFNFNANFIICSAGWNLSIWNNIQISVFHWKFYGMDLVFSRFKRCEERAPMDDTMKHMLPILYQRLAQLSAETSEASNLLQKQILKIYFAYIQAS